MYVCVYVCVCDCDGVCALVCTHACVWACAFLLLSQTRHHIFNLQQTYAKESLLSDYGELSIQFAYATLFIACCPSIAILAFALNYIEIRVDAYKFLAYVRRPVPVATNSIGPWEGVFTCTMIISVVTNAALLSFTLNAFGSTSHATKWMTFYFLQV